MHFPHYVHHKPMILTKNVNNDDDYAAMRKHVFLLRVMSLSSNVIKLTSSAWTCVSSVIATRMTSFQGTVSSRIDANWRDELHSSYAHCIIRLDHLHKSQNFELRMPEYLWEFSFLPLTRFCNDFWSSYLFIIYFWINY